jgi:hypothetical protein
MDGATIGATLTVVGLLIEVGAVYLILDSVGVPQSAWQRLKRFDSERTACPAKGSAGKAASASSPGMQRDR